MEDCWDQDAEARLTAQCAEERLSELGLLNTHTATHNHRYTPDNTQCVPQGPCRSLQVWNCRSDVVKFCSPVNGGKS